MHCKGSGTSAPLCLIQPSPGISHQGGIVAQLNTYRWEVTRKKKRGIFRVSKLDGYLQILIERYLGLIRLVQRVKTSQG